MENKPNNAQQQVNHLHNIFRSITMTRNGQAHAIPGGFAIGFRPVLLAKIGAEKRSLDPLEFEALVVEYLDSQQN